MAEKVLELGQGLELWKAQVEELREQDVNAQSMTKEAFDRLQTTIGRDSRLESLPFCALIDDHLEIVSGHHRVRAARSAGISDIFILVDVTGLTPDQVKAKQLAHNAITGDSDPELIRRIYEAIGDVDARMESFIDPISFDLDMPKVQIDDIDMGLHFETVIIMFVPWERQYFEDAARVIEREISGTKAKTVYMSELERFEAWQSLNLRLINEYDIRTMSTVMAKMAELALLQLGEAPPEPDVAQWVSLRDLIGTAMIPQAAAEVIRSALDTMTERGDIQKKNRWQGLEYMAAEYLASDTPPLTFDAPEPAEVPSP